MIEAKVVLPIIQKQSLKDPED